MWPFKKTHKHQLVIVAHRMSPTAWVDSNKQLVYGSAYFHRQECLNPSCPEKRWAVCNCPAVLKAASKKGSKIKVW